MFQRNTVKELLKRLDEKRQFIQVLTGPRQTGKTTIAQQVIKAVKRPSHYASADDPMLKGRSWIDQQWETIRAKIHDSPKKGLLILDEIQKIPHWAESVKRLWEEDTREQRKIQVIILGSSPLLMQKGLTESLTGRFEVVPVTHWSYREMREAFGWDSDEYVFYGGYPGSASLIQDQRRWANYIIDSLIETTISRDILLMTRVDKPALLRRLFELGCSYSGQILSYQKMLGQLQDAGNTVTLAHYLRLLEDAGLLCGVMKYAGQRVRQRGSSPKFQVLNTALLTAQKQSSFQSAKKDHEMWGHLVESAIGAFLVNSIRGTGIEVFYWRSRNQEVDFILCRDKELIAIEVKSGRKKETPSGMDNFSKEFKVAKKLLISKTGISIEEFLSTAPIEWF